MQITKTMEIRKQQVFVPDRKNHFSFAGTNPDNSFLNFLFTSGHFDLSAHLALKLYLRTAPVFSSVDLIAKEVSSIKPMLYDKVKEDYVDRHDILTLLKHPNPVQSQAEFMEEWATYFIVTGNEFLVATGSPSRPPLELFNFSPIHLHGEKSAKDGFVERYTAHIIGGGMSFNRLEDRKNFRFIHADMQELWHFKNFNPNSAAHNNTSAIFGLSRLTPIYYEIEQYNESSIHNLALLRNGTSVKSVLSTEQNLTDDQFARLQEEITNFYTGSENAGRPFLAEGGLTWQSMGDSLRDMDFLNMKRDTRSQIYTNLRIPLPLVLPEQMTLANMDAAKLIFYDNAVIPLFRRIAGDLERALFPRFKLDPERFELTFNEQSIPALSTRFISRTKELSQLGALTINELRRELGFGAITNGDEVMIPLNLIPVGQDLDKPPNPNEDNPDQHKRLDFFTRALAKKTNADGARVYSDEEIEGLAREHGIINE